MLVLGMLEVMPRIERVKRNGCMLGLLNFSLFQLFIHQPNDVQTVGKLMYLNQFGACFKLMSLEG